MRKGVRKPSLKEGAILRSPLLNSRVREAQTIHGMLISHSLVPLPRCTFQCALPFCLREFPNFDPKEQILSLFYRSEADVQIKNCRDRM